MFRLVRRLVVGLFAVIGLVAALLLVAGSVAAWKLAARSPSVPGAMIPTWWTTAPVESGVLTGWAGGPLALELSALGPEARRNRALECLAQLFGTPRGMLEDLLEDEVIHDWQADPFARGGYAVTPVGALGAARVLARPVADTLFFAGEHTHTGGQAGTVHGALETGEAAARACLAVLREGRSRR